MIPAIRAGDSEPAPPGSRSVVGLEEGCRPRAREPRNLGRRRLLVAPVLRVPGQADALGEPGRAEEEQGQQDRAGHGPLEHRPGGDGAEREHDPPLGLLEEEVRVAAVAEQSGPDEPRVGRGLRLLPLLEVPLLLVGDCLTGQAAEEHRRGEEVGRAEAALVLVRGQRRQRDQQQQHVLVPGDEEQVEQLELPPRHPAAQDRPPVVLAAPRVPALAGEVERQPGSPQRDQPEHEVEPGVGEAGRAGEDRQVRDRHDRPDPVGPRVLVGQQRHEPAGGDDADQDP